MKTTETPLLHKSYVCPQVTEHNVFVEKGVCTSGFDGSSIDGLYEDDSWGNFFNE